MLEVYIYLYIYTPSQPVVPATSEEAYFVTTLSFPVLDDYSQCTPVLKHFLHFLHIEESNQESFHADHPICHHEHLNSHTLIANKLSITL